MTNSQPSPLALEPTPRQTEILEQALQLVQAHGLANLTLKKVAERVGFTEAAIYRHFANKEELLFGLIGSLQGRLLGPISAIAADRTLPAAERVERMVRHHVGLLRATQGLPILLMAEGLASGDQRLIERLARVMRAYLGQLTTVLAELEPPVGVAPSRHAILFLGLPAALGMQARANPDLAPGDDEVEELVRFYVNALTSGTHRLEESKR